MNNEVIIKVEHEDLDVTWQGCAILTREQVALLQQGLASGERISYPNMPAHWEEDFPVSELEEAFGILSEDAEDVAYMRRLFGEIIGETSLIWQVLDLVEEEDSSAEDADETENPEIIDLDVAEAYIENPDSFDLSGATEITDAAAEALGKYDWEGKYDGELCLNGLRALSDAAAEALSKHEGYLFLNGVAELSDTGASFLAKSQGSLGLDGLTDLSDVAAEALAEHPGFILTLNGLESLSDSAAKSIGKHAGFLYLNGLKGVSEIGAKALAEHDEYLEMNGLTEITETVAAALAKHSDELHLDGLTTLSDEAAEALSKC
ncbi:MAG: hypothetical protein P1U87_20740, partial [Verrucomicrobiales bacterium]|nr:hypothetical protein [Verrucomicrobiales bacterium]